MVYWRNPLSSFWLHDFSYYSHCNLLRQPPHTTYWARESKTNAQTHTHTSIIILFRREMTRGWYKWECSWICRTRHFCTYSRGLLFKLIFNSCTDWHFGHVIVRRYANRWRTKNLIKLRLHLLTRMELLKVLFSTVFTILEIYINKERRYLSKLNRKRSLDLDLHHFMYIFMNSRARNKGWWTYRENFEMHLWRRQQNNWTSPVRGRSKA